MGSLVLLVPPPRPYPTERSSERSCADATRATWSPATDASGRSAKVLFLLLLLLLDGQLATSSRHACLACLLPLMQSRDICKQRAILYTSLPPNPRARPSNQREFYACYHAWSLCDLLCAYALPKHSITPADACTAVYYHPSPRHTDSHAPVEDLGTYPSFQDLQKSPRRLRTQDADSRTSGTLFTWLSSHVQTCTS